MSDEEIAKRCSLKVSDVRSVLNRLHEYGITSYNRERDKDTGWYSYNWTVNTIRLYELLEGKKAKGERMDEEALAFEKSYTFYTCANAECSGSGQRVPESDAILTTYSCERCGERMKVFDNSEIIKSIEQKLASRHPAEETFIREIVRQVPKKAKALRTGKPARASKARGHSHAPVHKKHSASIRRSGPARRPRAKASKRKSVFSGKKRKR